MISKYFSLREATFLPKWSKCADASDGLTPEILSNLAEVFFALDTLREHFAAPIIVHVAYRPPTYNALVGGAPKSAHMSGRAVDFHVKGFSCDDVRKEILANGYLELLGLRMEDNPDSNWVHIDTNPPGPSGRFFPI